jgi:hypothetical protein
MPKRSAVEMPRGFVKCNLGNVRIHSIQRLSEEIYDRVKRLQRPIGVVINDDGELYASEHLSSGFQRIMHNHHRLVVGVYNSRGSPELIAGDITEHAVKEGVRNKLRR